MSTNTSPSYVLEIVTSYVHKNTAIRGLGLIGSWARHDYGPRSDIDLIILIDSGTSIESFIEGLASGIALDIRESLKPYSNKIIFFVGDDFLKIDIFVVHDLSDIEKYYRSPPIPKVEDTILVDKDGVLYSTFIRWINNPINSNLTSLIIDTTEKFLESFELASRYAYQDDAYRFYFNYNIALFYYASLVQLETGDYTYIYTPRKLLDHMDAHKRDSIITLVPSLIISEAFPHLKALGKEYSSVYNRLSLRYKGLPRKTANIRRFIKRILERDMF